jgi:cardiolipin synthase
MSAAREIDGHRLTLLQNGTEYFPQLLEAIHAARRSIYLEAYIFASDETARQLKEALECAAARAVSVHVLLDGFGSADLPQVWQDEMRNMGVKVLWFRPELARLSLRRHRLRRLHRKLVLIDESVAFIGGINIIDDVPPGMQAPRLDYAVEVRGAVVGQIAHSMRKLWRLVSWTNFRRWDGHLGPLPHQDAGQDKKVTFLIRDNLRHRRDIEHAYLWALGHAQHEIIIANAYFLPGHRFRHFLIKAAHRGVRVVLLLQGRVEYRLQHYATLALYEELLQAGIEIHEYTRSFLHAKVAVVDGEWATVGSSNIDPFSLWLAREANLVVRDSGFAEELRDSLLHEMQAGARRIRHEDWHRRGLWHRFVLRVSYALIRFVADMVGYAHKIDDI